MSKSIKDTLKEIGKLLNDNIKEKVYYFNSISDMKSSTKLKAGDMVITKGYYESNDGGSGEYEIVDSSTLVDDGGSIHDLGNGLKAKLIIKNGEVNVKQFGAKGDGSTDDTQSIQNCIDKFSFLKLPYGEYCISSLTLKDGLTINGTHKFEYSWDNKSNDICVLKANSQNKTMLKGTDGVNIKNILINGNDKTNNAIESGNNIYMENVRIFNCNEGVGRLLSGSVINNCQFDNNITAIERLVDSRVISNTFNKNDLAINMKYSNDNIIIGNKIEWNGNGIYMEDALNNTISNNVIDRNTHYGLYFKNTVCLTFTNNVVRRNLEYNVYNESGSYINICNNILKSDRIIDGDDTSDIKPNINIKVKSLSNSNITDNNVNGNLLDKSEATLNNVKIKRNIGNKCPIEEFRKQVEFSLTASGNYSTTINYPTGYDKWNTHLTAVKIAFSSTFSFEYEVDKIKTKVTLNDGSISVLFTNLTSNVYDRVTAQLLFTYI